MPRKRAQLKLEGHRKALRIARNLDALFSVGPEKGAVFIGWDPGGNLV